MESKTEILKAMNTLMQEVSFVAKEKNPNLKFGSVNYDSLLDEVREPALRLGLFMLPSKCHHTNCTPYERQGYEGKLVNMKCDSYVFTFTIWHISGEFLTVEVPAVGVDEQDKGPGKAITYATKNAWLKALMLKSGDDPDHDAPRQDSRPQQQPVRTASDVRTQNAQQQRPQGQQQQPVRQGGTLTADPATWPAEWQNVLKAGTAAAKDKDKIHSDKDFKVMELLRASKESIEAKSPPKIIIDTIMHQVSGWLINTVMKTGHAQVSCTAVLENWPEFEGYIGKGEKADKIKKVLEDYTPW